MKQVQAYEASYGSLHKTPESAAQASIVDLLSNWTTMPDTLGRNHVADFFIENADEVMRVLAELKDAGDVKFDCRVPWRNEYPGNWPEPDRGEHANKTNPLSDHSNMWGGMRITSPPLTEES